LPVSRSAFTIYTICTPLSTPFEKKIICLFFKFVLTNVYIYGKV
jgi:hypothetical protein